MSNTIVFENMKNKPDVSKQHIRDNKNRKINKSQERGNSSEAKERERKQ